MDNTHADACLVALKLLVRAGASVTAAHHRTGVLPLEQFLRSRSLQFWRGCEVAAVVDTLVAAGASATAANEGRWRPLDYAVLIPSKAAAQGTVEALVAAGADVRQVSSRGKTLLHRVAECGSAQSMAAVIKMLLAAGCDPLAVDSKGQLAAQLLQQRPPSGSDSEAAAVSRAAQLLLDAMAAHAAAAQAAVAAQRAQQAELEAQLATQRAQLAAQQAQLAAQQAQLVAQQEQQEEQSLCMICTARPRTMGLMPCCHWGYCSDCADRLQKCPVCSRLVESKARIYAL
ncbi:hypothetical protein COHA_005805 [Chlorella ohadii]|uniref:RING-type domain-containing protein n=1 Tax=Chlorella ohadii TaxID=2649997 RepID=A0AAD5DP40_9CHLO|nr:hypothetical protein COHA_005805 [Chlorella ohadii]